MGGCKSCCSCNINFHLLSLSCLNLLAKSIFPIFFDSMRGTEMIKRLIFNNKFVSITNKSIANIMSLERNQIQVLEAFQPFFSMLSVYRSNKSYGKNQPTYFHYIQAIIFSVFFSAIIITSITAFWYCFNESNKNGVKSVALPLSMSICCTEIIIIYFEISSKNQMVYEIIQRLQRIIDNRTYLISSYFFRNNKF